MSVVFEMQQGLIDRGADLSRISQYPHEKEILFGPLTGLTVMKTRVEESVLVVEARLNSNLLALTIEEVVSKRRKVVMDMAANVLVDFERNLSKDEAWALLDQPQASAYLKKLLEPLCKREPEHYNNDANLGEAINDAVFRANAVRGWGRGLQARRPLTDAARAKDACLTQTDSRVCCACEQLAQRLFWAGARKALRQRGAGAPPDQRARPE